MRSVYVRQAPWVIESSRPDKDWPKQGVVEFKNYSMSYRAGLEPVLKSISCNIKGGEKVGGFIQWSIDSFAMLWMWYS